MKSFTTYLSILGLCILPLQTNAQELSKEDSAKLIKISEVAEKNAGITTTEPKLVDFETTLFCIGRIKAIPNRHAVLSSRIPGRIVSSPPMVGDIVKKGEVLIKVESRQPGSPPPVIPLKAPISGLVTESHITLGQPVEPATELMDIVDISQVWAVAHIPESKAADVKIGQEARIRVATQGDRVYTGKLIRFGTEADPKSGTIEAIFLLDNSDHKLRPNMRTEFNIITKSRPKVLAIPKTAILGDTMDTHVFVRYDELPNTFRKVPVVIGERNDKYVEIIKRKDGISVVDDVVVTGGYFLTHSGSDKGSIKEALDAAHGHEHNADGSEMTPEQRKAKEAEKRAAAGGSGGEGEYSSSLVTALIATNVITLLILALTIFKKKDVA